MSKNERTSKKVAAIAGKVLAMQAMQPGIHPTTILAWKGFGAIEDEVVRWSDVIALAASCLNQSPDRPKKSRTVRERVKGKDGWSTKAGKNHKPIARKIALRGKRGGKGFAG